jgi:hypothetical protein
MNWPLDGSLPAHAEIPGPDFPDTHPSGWNNDHLNLAVVQLHHIDPIPKAPTEPSLIDPISASCTPHFAGGNDKMFEVLIPANVANGPSPSSHSETPYTISTARLTESSGSLHTFPVCFLLEDNTDISQQV